MSLEDEIRRAADAATAAAKGKTGDEAWAAALAASIDFGLPDLQRNLPRLEIALGEAIDPGSFSLGMIVTTFAAQQLDVISVIQRMPVLRDAVREHMVKAREGRDG